MSILITCRRCGTEFEPGRKAIIAGAWRLCPDCRDGTDTPRGPAVCPQCHRVVKSGTHRGRCPGRRRRNRGVHSDA
jgi:hypothetical protein